MPFLNWENRYDSLPSIECFCWHSLIAFLIIRPFFFSTTYTDTNNEASHEVDALHASATSNTTNGEHKTPANADLSTTAKRELRKLALVRIGQYFIAAVVLYTFILSLVEVTHMEMDRRIAEYKLSTQKCLTANKACDALQLAVLNHPGCSENDLLVLEMAQEMCREAQSCIEELLALAGRIPSAMTPLLGTTLRWFGEQLFFVLLMGTVEKNTRDFLHSQRLPSPVLLRAIDYAHVGFVLCVLKCGVDMGTSVWTFLGGVFVPCGPVVIVALAQWMLSRLI